MKSAHNCVSYFQNGYCTRGPFCPKLHAPDAMTINDVEFFHFWKNDEKKWRDYQRKHKIYRRTPMVNNYIADNQLIITFSKMYQCLHLLISKPHLT